MGSQDGLRPDSGQRDQRDIDNNATGDDGALVCIGSSALTSAGGLVKRSMVPSATLNQRDWVLR